MYKVKSVKNNKRGKKIRFSIHIINLPSIKKVIESI